jgi:iron complex outermembrane receptor protein
MQISFKSIRCGLAAGVAVFSGAQLSFAQTGVSGNSGAAAAESQESTSLEEVTVTAQLRGSERLIDTPVSIGVLTGAALEDSSVRGVSEALSQVGGVSVITTQPGESNISIRGVVGGQFGAPTIGYYLDEVPFAFIDQTQSPDANAFDLQRVEVLRGPQGTLFGASAMGGVVRIVTQDPDLTEWEGKARATGSYTQDGGGNYGGDLVLNAPLIPGVLAVRSVASYDSLSGFIDSAGDGSRNINSTQTQSYRLKVLAQPTDDLSLKFGYSHSAITNSAPYYADEDLATPFDNNQYDNRKYDTYNLIAQYQLPWFNILSSTSYLNYLSDAIFDFLLAGSPFPLYNHYGLESASQEVRLTSTLHGPWQWSAGVFYKSTKEFQGQTFEPVFSLPYGVHIRSESAAVFGELTREVGDRFEVTAGLRYFRDDQLNVQQSNFLPGPLAPATTSTFEHVTGRLILKYNFDRDLMVYSSVATGFRSGLNQSSGVLAVDPSFAPLKPDSLTTVEVGSKARVLDGRLSFDTALYYTHWIGVQQSLQLPAGFVAYVNAGDARGVGVDTSVEYQATSNLSFQGNVGWNGLRFGQDVLQNNIVFFARGTRLNESPQFTATLSSNYRFPVGLPSVNGVLGTTLNYSSAELLRTFADNIVTTTDSDNIVTAGGKLGVEAGQWSAELFADNIFNNREALTPPDVTYDNQSLRLRPRTLGLRANYKF